MFVVSLETLLLNYVPDGTKLELGILSTDPTMTIPVSTNGLGHSPKILMFCLLLEMLLT